MARSVTSSHPLRKSPAISTREYSGCSLFQCRNCMFQQRRCLVQVKLRFSAVRDREILQNFRLQRSAKAFDLADAVVLRSGFKFGKRANAELLMKLQDLVGPKSRNGEQFKHAFRHFLAQLLKTWMRSGLVELGR